MIDKTLLNWAAGSEGFFASMGIVYNLLKPWSKIFCQDIWLPGRSGKSGFRWKSWLQRMFHKRCSSMFFILGSVFTVGWHKKSDNKAHLSMASGCRKMPRYHVFISWCSGQLVLADRIAPWWIILPCLQYGQTRISLPVKRSIFSWVVSLPICQILIALPINLRINSTALPLQELARKP